MDLSLQRLFYLSRFYVSNSDTVLIVFLPNPSCQMRVFAFHFIGLPGFEFPRESGQSSRRGATLQIARVRQHPSHPTRRGSRKGRGRCMGTNGRG